VKFSKEDQAEWSEMQAKRLAAEVEVRVASGALEKLAAKAFQESLRKGKWVLKYDGALGPVDHAAEDALHEMVATAFQLGYHDSFFICDGVITINGYTNDGAITLQMYSHKQGKEVADEFKRLQVDVDLTAFLHSHLYDQLRSARSDLMTAHRKVGVAEKALTELGLPLEEPEEGSGSEPTP
jgi:hypothetical protein